MNKKYFIFFCLSAMLSAKGFAQNVTSPYSILGIGDLETDDYGRYSGSGSAAVSRREAGGYYNFSNPASLTAMPYKAINFDFGLRGRVNQFKQPGIDTLTQVSKDFLIKRITIAFKVTPSMGFAFGLKPFSTSNYQYLTNTLLGDGVTSLYKSVSGSGGLYQTYFSLGKEFNKHLSAGVTASWLFGAMQNSSEFISPALNLDITKNINKYYNGAGLQAGVQYYSLPGKKFQHTLGLTVSAYNKLKGPSTTNFMNGTTVIDTLVPSTGTFKMPLILTGGYSIGNKNGLSLHLQGSFEKWPNQALAFQNSKSSNALKFNVGMEYSKNAAAGDYTYEKYYVAWGAKIEQSYVTVGGLHLNTYAGTLGIGRQLSRYISASAGIEGGVRGLVTWKQIQENYFQINLGLTVKDIWFSTRKMGRYN